MLAFIAIIIPFAIWLTNDPKEFKPAHIISIGLLVLVAFVTVATVVYFLVQPEQEPSQAETSSATVPPTPAQQTNTPETPIPTPTSQPAVVEVTYPQQFFAEDRIPDDTFMTITVNDGEVHAMTSGTICVADVCLPGGTDRGSVVIFLPTATYEVTGLNPKWNWHGAYYATPNQWEKIAEQLASEQKIPGTCSDGDGCSIVDVAVVSPSGIVAQYQD